jgi:hypothetical protein
VDLGTLVHSARRVGADEPRSGVERIGLSTRLLLPMLQQAGTDPGLTELARDLKVELAARGGRSVTLVLPLGGAGDAQGARLELGGRQFTIPPVLRDALLAQLAAEPDSAAAIPAPVSATRAAAAPAGTAAGETAARAWAVHAQAHAAAAHAPGLPLQAAVALAASGVARDVARSLSSVAPAVAGEPPVAGFARPLLQERPVGPVTPTQPIAARLRQQLERSGLFFESHLAQWAGGARSTDELRAELLQLQGGAAAAAPAEAPAQRVAAQLAVLQHQGLVLHGPAWPGQPMQLAIEREPLSRDAPAGAPPVFSAHLKLELPQLGAVEVHLRLAGDALATTLGGAGAAGLVGELPALVDALHAHGLNPVVTQVTNGAA